MKKLRLQEMMWFASGPSSLRGTGRIWTLISLLHPWCSGLKVIAIFPGIPAAVGEDSIRIWFILDQLLYWWGWDISWGFLGSIVPTLVGMKHYNSLLQTKRKEAEAGSPLELSRGCRTWPSLVLPSPLPVLHGEHSGHHSFVLPLPFFSHSEEPSFSLASFRAWEQGEDTLLTLKGGGRQWWGREVEAGGWWPYLGKVEKKLLWEARE